MQVQCPACQAIFNVPDAYACKKNKCLKCQHSFFAVKYAKEAEEDKKLIPSPKTRFAKIKCNGCGNTQRVFSSASSEVKCLVCSEVLAKSSGAGTIFIGKEVKE